MSESFEHEISQQLAQLTPEQQREVLSFIRSLGAKPEKGTRGRDLLKLVGSIPHDDLELMKAAIEEGCEQIDLEGWQ